MSDTAISVQGLGKRFRLKHREARKTLREDLLELPRTMAGWFNPTKSADEDFWALREVSFDVKPGEAVGIIGRNGAGKSTLLKILSRVLEPTCGEAIVEGRIGSLLEVGTGFHPELTGRENIFLSGALLGMKRGEIRRRFDEIVAFAGVEKFLDTPCKHYSSGMYTRLGFAVAAHLDAEILLMDEVLAVGDAEFRERCRIKMQDMVRTAGRVVILVSHDPALVRNLCSKAIWLDAGSVKTIGAAAEVLNGYHQERVTSQGTILDAVSHVVAGLHLAVVRVGDSESRRVVVPSDAPYLEIEISGSLDFSARVALEVRLCDDQGAVLAFFSPGHLHGRIMRLEPGPFKICERLVLPRLLRGNFFLSLALTDPNRKCWCELGMAVCLEAEGANTNLGSLPAGGHCGWMLLDESIEREFSSP